MDENGINMVPARTHTNMVPFNGKHCSDESSCASPLRKSCDWAIWLTSSMHTKTRVRGEIDDADEDGGGEDEDGGDDDDDDGGGNDEVAGINTAGECTE